MFYGQDNPFAIHGFSNNAADNLAGLSATFCRTEVEPDATNPV
jgi:hypothetical protein